MFLKRFSQEVDLDDPTVVHYFLVFDHKGKEIRLPVQSETTEALTQELYGNGDVAPSPPKQETNNEPLNEELEGSTSFGGEEEPPPMTDDPYEDREDDFDGVPPL